MANPIKKSDDGSYYYRQTHDEVVARQMLSSLNLPPKNVGVLAGENAASAQTTCTYQIALKRYPSSEIIGYSRFELAIDALKKGENDSVLVAGAFPNIRNFFMDRHIVATDTFLEYIPTLVLVSKILGWPIDQATTLYTHPAPRSLAENCPHESIIECSSNEQVCVKLLADEDPFAVGVTNEFAANHFKLPIREILHQPNMGWVLFRRK